MKKILESFSPNGTESPIGDSGPANVSDSHALRNTRVFVFFSLAVLLTGLGSLLFADLLWRTGWSGSRILLLALFTILFLLASLGCVHGVYGFFLRRQSRREQRFGDYASRSLNGTTTAIVLPIYNESARRVFAGLQAIHRSLAQTEHLDRFDFFVLSDSSEPDKWVEEERRWFGFVREVGAFGRIHYRRRPENIGKKSGNIRDFLRSWGRRYRYFIVLDADSIMTGRTIVDLVKIMETNPRIGLLQTAPALVNARSAFGRMQQFANRLYGPLFTAGLDYWSQGGGNYWGHNAIIRVEPFMQYCDLPHLPGRKPFGGHILSHDFVEAALLRRENWQVCMAPELEGSYEESPPGILENAQRDRRWCQGNLQHALVLFARGLRGESRMHLAFGVFGYLAGPLWLVFLLTSTWLLWYRENSGLSDVIVSAFTPIIRLARTGHALLIFGLVLGVLFLPKVLSLLDLAFDARRRQDFGGLGRASLSALGETLFSTLHAPLQMLFHTKFVAASFLGMQVHWTTQARRGDGTSWRAAARQHGSHTLLGLAWGGFTWEMDHEAFWWFCPVLVGLIFSIPLSVFSSRESLGRRLRHVGLFLTPEETSPTAELRDLERRMHQLDHLSSAGKGEHLRGAILDPYVNALHVTLLCEGQRVPFDLGGNVSDKNSRSLPTLAERLLTQGPDRLSRAECLDLLSDPQLLLWLHREAWQRSSETLASFWTQSFTDSRAQPG